MEQITFEQMKIEDGDVILLIHTGDIPVASLQNAMRMFNGFTLAHKKDTLLLSISEKDLFRKDTLQLTNDGRNITFSSGRTERVNEGIIGITADSKAIADAYGPFPDYKPKLSNEELIELSTHMICRWLKVMRRAGGETNDYCNLRKERGGQDDTRSDDSV